MLRTGLLMGLLWLALGTITWAGEPERTFHHCGEVIAIAEPLMTKDAFKQLLALSETECMAAFGDFTPLSLSHMLAEEAVRICVEGNCIVYTKNLKPPDAVAEVVSPSEGDHDSMGPWQQGILRVLSWMVDVANTSAEFVDSLYDKMFGHTHGPN
jgi:hypothetical protein